MEEQESPIDFGCGIMFRWPLVRLSSWKDYLLVVENLGSNLTSVLKAAGELQTANCQYQIETLRKQIELDARAALEQIELLTRELSNHADIDTDFLKQCGISSADF